MSAGRAERNSLERNAPVLAIMGHVRDRSEGLDAADTNAKAAFIDRILSALGWELR
jgi:hypothetical protein